MSKTSPSILIVDDDIVSREMLLEMLVSKYTCKSVSCGEDAIETFVSSFRGKNLTKFDLILLDYEMPDVNGIEVLMQIKKEENKRNIASTDKVKVIMTTSHNDRNIVLGCKTAGADNYLLKPIEEKSLHSKVSQLLAP